MELTFAVTDWAVWPPLAPAGLASTDIASRDIASTDIASTDTASKEIGEGINAEPDVSCVPPMLRRRLNKLGRLTVSLILPLLKAHGEMPMVFCSRHGDVARTLTMLQSLAEQEPLSPTAFSLSVHNALAGLFSIHQKNRQAITAIAAGEEEVIPALLEGLGLLEQRVSEHVLCVFYDEPLPEYYLSDLPPTERYAAAFVLSRGQALALSHVGDAEADHGQGGSLRPQAQAMQFCEFLDRTEEVCQFQQWQIQRL